MERASAHICLALVDRGPEHGVHTLTTAAKILSELRAGRQDRDISVSWKLASSDCGADRQIVLCGCIEFRSQWQLQAYSDYIQKQVCDMIDDRKVSFHLQVGDCQGNGG